MALGGEGLYDKLIGIINATILLAPLIQLYAWFSEVFGTV